MNNKIKPAIFLFICSLFFQASYSQVQNNIPDYLKQKFLKYIKNVPREEIFLHSDKEDYIAGEDLWFNLYLIDRQTFSLSLNSKIVYFELLNTENRPIIQKRFILDDGSGPGRIVLPDTLGSGVYTIRAYTNWMKNFMPENCFIKDINVYNALNAMAFKGKRNAAGPVRNSSNGNISGEILKSGLSLKVNNSEKDFLELFIDTDSNFQVDNDNLFYIFIQTHGNINHVSSEKITGSTTKVVVPRYELNAGITQITIFNSRGKPVADRYVYSGVRGKDILTLNMADSCGLRNKIKLGLSLENVLPDDLKSTKLSISVAPLISDRGMTDFNDYMVCGTEFGLPVMKLLKKARFQTGSSESIDSLLLNARSNWINWPAILSGEQSHFKYLSENGFNILSGKLLTSDQKLISAPENLFLCIPSKEASFQYAKTDENGNFIFRIHADEELKDLVIMPERNDAGFKTIIESPFYDQYPKSSTYIDSTSSVIAARISKMSINHQVQAIFGSRSVESTSADRSAKTVMQRFYGKPDIELVLADYVTLPVMSEVIFELLPGVSLKKKRSGYEFTITEHKDDGLVVSYPTLMIDGVIISDPSLIVNLDPELVEKIDVIKSKYEVGHYVFTGIINVITKSGDFSGVSLPDYMIRMPYRVTEPVLTFVSPDYSSVEVKENRVPDYRNTLYWNPLIAPDKDGKSVLEFWSSDNKGDYIINIQGVTQRGNILSAEKVIRVR